MTGLAIVKHLLDRIKKACNKYCLSAHIESNLHFNPLLIFPVPWIERQP